MKHTLLLGAEGCAETENVDWVREASDREAVDFWAEVREQGLTGIATVDKIGRPYWLMTVTEEAPKEVLEAIKDTYRAVRLKAV